MKKTQLDASKVCFNEKYLERNKLREDIRQKEEESMATVHSFQEIYDNEIADVSYMLVTFIYTFLYFISVQN